MRSGNWSSSHWKGRIVVLVLVEESGQPRLCLVHDVKMGDRSKGVSAPSWYSLSLGRLLLAFFRLRLLSHACCVR